MNGFFIFVIVMFLFRKRILLLNAKVLRSDSLRAIEECLRKNDFRLSGFSPEIELQKQCKSYVLNLVRDGIQPGDALKSLVGFYDEAQRLQDESLHLLRSYLAHLSFVILVPLSIRMILKARIVFMREDSFALYSGIMAMLMALYLMSRFWPKIPLLAEGEGLDFFKAFLGRARGTRYEKLEAEIRERYRREGWDARQLIESILETQFRQELSQARMRLEQLENALGPLELALSAAFGFVFLAQPLWERFHGLFSSLT